MRYVLIRDDASLDDIDEALTVLGTKRRLTTLEVTKRWIAEDEDELLELRLVASGSARESGRKVSDDVPAQPTV